MCLQTTGICFEAILFWQPPNTSRFEACGQNICTRDEIEVQEEEGWRVKQSFQYSLKLIQILLLVNSRSLKTKNYSTYKVEDSNAGKKKCSYMQKRVTSEFSILHVFAPFAHLWLSHYIITWWRGLFRASPHLPCLTSIGGNHGQCSLFVSLVTLYHFSFLVTSTFSFFCCVIFFKTL